MNQPDDISEEEQANPPGSGKRYLKARRFIKLFRTRRVRLFVALVIVALLFAGTAAAQHWFVRRQLYETTRQELGAWAAEISKEIAFKDKWDLAGYRRTSITAPSWYVVAEDGLIIDIEGFIPGLFGRVEAPDESVFSAPQTVVSGIGEKWRLFGRKLKDGVVVVGISAPENLSDADARLVSSATRFGSTLDEAISAGPRDVDFSVDYAALNSAGELRAAWGGVPLKTDPRTLPMASDRLSPLSSRGKPYLLYSQPILDSSGKQVGAIIVPKDMSLETKALAAQDLFNLWVVGISMLAAFIVALLLIVLEFLGKTKKVTVEEALRIGESGTIEFKSTFEWDVKQNEFVRERKLDVLKSIAGFLNAKGGTLFIGVSEDTDPPCVRGLTEDFKRAGNSKDELQLKLRNLISETIGSEFAPLISDSLEEFDGRKYWMVVVEDSPEPAFVLWKGQKKFYVREGPKTSDLNTEAAWHYIKNKWG